MLCYILGLLHGVLGSLAALVLYGILWASTRGGCRGRGGRGGVRYLAR
jgi:hypothetical protein